MQIRGVRASAKPVGQVVERQAGLVPARGDDVFALLPPVVDQDQLEIADDLGLERGPEYVQPAETAGGHDEAGGEAVVLGSHGSLGLMGRVP